MKYKRFIISHYRGVSENVTVDLSKKSIIPIIGVNESGKTSILEAILAFDKFNDSTNKGKHLERTENFYDPVDERSAIVQADISITTKELKEILEELFEKDENGEFTHHLMEEHSEEVRELYNKPVGLADISICRDIPSKGYSSSLNIEEEVDDWLCDQILKELPYILYFDDFRDEIPQYIGIPEKEDDENQSKWVPYFQELVQQVNPKHDLYELRDRSDNIRSTVIRDAQVLLQEKLAKHWKNFSVQDSNSLQIELNYHPEHTLEVKIVEEVEVGDRKRDTFFDIKDRSKGFYWYFNFIMKLEFNPKKRHSSDKETIYLLDEPGSYLHATAQKKLCDRLEAISTKNKVVYCTHSPYLLNPEKIPLNNIHVARKEGKCDICLESIHSTKISRKNAAFQPILHALEIAPSSLDYDKNNIVLTEGIYDYYVFEIMKTKKSLSYFPCDSCDSIKHHISYMIFLGKKYSVLWDKDEDGETAFTAAKKAFGPHESKKWGFYQKGRSKKVILQDLIEGTDMKMIKETLEIPRNSSFEKTIAALYFSPKKRTVLRGISKQTKANFLKIEKDVIDRMKI